MAELKTKQNDASVEKFLNDVADDRKRNDCFTVLEIMKQATKSEPKMWGTSIVGFGSYCYRYESGRELSWFFTGFFSAQTGLDALRHAGIQGLRRAAEETRKAHDREGVFVHQENRRY
jgi:hypothetical protein